MLQPLFAAIDAKDTSAFLSFLSPSCRFRFGNGPEVLGAEQIGPYVAGFFAAVKALRHDILASWPVPGGLICHGMVHYTRADDSTLSVPFANVFQMDAQGISDYLIFSDNSALFQP